MTLMMRGTIAAVRAALRPIARLAQQPASSLSLKARAVAMPWLAVPSATPRAEGDSILAQLRIYGPHTAPIIPVTMVRHAVTAGKPPIPRAISIDTAAVADFGAMESRMGSDALSTFAISNPQTMLAWISTDSEWADRQRAKRFI